MQTFLTNSWHLKEKDSIVTIIQDSESFSDENYQILPLARSVPNGTNKRTIAILRVRVKHQAANTLVREFKSTIGTEIEIFFARFRLLWIVNNRNGKNVNNGNRNENEREINWKSPNNANDEDCKYKPNQFIYFKRRDVLPRKFRWRKRKYNFCPLK